MRDFNKDIERDMVEHMNEDHVDAMCDYCRLQNIDTSNAVPKMVSIDFNGFDLQVDERIHRFIFERPCETPNDVRKALVELAKQARQSDN